MQILFILKQTGIGIQTVGVDNDPLEAYKSIRISGEFTMTNFYGIKELDEKYEKNSNTFTIGNTSITLTEPNIEHTVDHDYGGYFSNDPTITVNSTNNTYIFMRVDVPSEGFNDKYRYEIKDGWKEIATTENTKYSNYRTHIYAYVNNDNKLNTATNGTTSTLFTEFYSTDPSYNNIYVKSEMPAYGYAIEASQTTDDPVETFKKFIEKYKDKDDRLNYLDFKEE